MSICRQNWTVSGASASHTVSVTEQDGAGRTQTGGKELLELDVSKRDFWCLYKELRMGSSKISTLALVEHLRLRLPETELHPTAQKHMELFLDPYWIAYLDKFPEEFPPNKPETFAPVILDNLVVAAGYLRETERRTMVDLVRRKVLPPFKCTFEDIAEQVHEVIVSIQESKTLGLEALKAAKNIVQQYTTLDFTRKMDTQNAFVRQPGYQDAQIKLTGDLHILGARQREVLLMLQHAHGVTKLHIQQVAKSFGGGLVVFVTPFRGSEKMPSSVVKLGTVDELFEEVKKTTEFAPYFGLTTPRVKNYVTLPDYSSNEIAAAMELELCGGVFGLPAFANTPAVMTLEKIVSDRFDATFCIAQNLSGLPSNAPSDIQKVSNASFADAKGGSGHLRICDSALNTADSVSHTEDTSLSSKALHNRHRAWISQGGCQSPHSNAGEQKDDTSHVDLPTILVEVLERNLWGFVFNTPNDGPSVRKVLTVDLVEMYRIQHLIQKAVTNRHKLIDADCEIDAKLIAFEECDPQGLMQRAVVGEKYQHLSLKEFFAKVGEACEKFRHVQVVTGRCHGDLHGGNLLIDSHGMAWLIDFATAKPSGMHVLYDLTKLLMSALVLYPYDDDDETAINSLFQVMAALPSNRHIIAESAYRCIEPRWLQFAWEFAARLRSAATKYEADDELDSPYPWVIAMLSWCLRISTYQEPKMPQIRLCLFGALCMGTRLLYMDQESAPAWIAEARESFVSSKISMPPLSSGLGVGSGLNRDLQRYLVSVATKDSWLTDPITRQQTQVGNMQASCTYYGPQKRHMQNKQIRHMLSSSGQRAKETLNLVLQACLSSSSTVQAHSGRLLVISESGMGKTLLTKQLTSQVAQMQLMAASGSEDSRDRIFRLTRRMVPIRVPLVDFPKLYRENPDCIECDPQKDFLALWSEWKFGKTGTAAQLIKTYRQASVISQQKTHEIIRDSDDNGYNASECFLMCVFDGLDECADNWQQCLKFISNFVESEPRHICVLTARPWEDAAITQLQEMHNFSAFRIMPLSQEQSEQFCRCKLQMQSTPEGTIERIVRVVCSSEYKEVRTIPLILSLLLNFHRVSMTNQESSPLSKTTVYRHAVHLMLYQVGANKVAARDVAQHDALIQLNKCRMLLRHAAWIAHRDRALTFGIAANRRAAVRADVCSRTAPVFWAELRVLAETAGLLEPLERLIAATAAGHTPLLCGDQIKFRFARLAYEELLCGEFMACVLTQDQLLTTELFHENLELLQDESWHEPILHCLSSLSDSTMVHWLHTYILHDQATRTCVHPSNASPRNPNAQLLLKIAAQFGSKVVVETLLQAKVSPNCRFKDGNTPLHLAAKLGHTAVVASLIAFKASTKGLAALNNNWRTPLQEAILSGNVDVYRVLTRNSATRGFPTDKAMHDSSSSNSVLHSNNVTASKASRPSKHELPELMISSYDGAYLVVEAQLKNIPTSSVNARCPGPARASALCFAAENGRPKIVKLLLSAGLDCNIRYGRRNCSVLFWPCFAGYYEVVRLLLESNALPDGVKSFEERLVNELTPLHAAAATGHVVTVELLLNFGADPLICYKPLMLRPIHFAAFFGSDEIYNLLISRGDTGNAEHGSSVGPEDLRHLYECPPGSIPKYLQKLSKKMERLF